MGTAINGKYVPETESGIKVGVSYADSWANCMFFWSFEKYQAYLDKMQAQFDRKKRRRNKELEVLEDDDAESI